MWQMVAGIFLMDAVSFVNNLLDLNFSNCSFLVKAIVREDNSLTDLIVTFLELMKNIVAHSSIICQTNSSIIYL